MAQQSKNAAASVTWLGPDIKEPVDTSPSDQQPPGVDDDLPQSLEEALLGE